MRKESNFVKTFDDVFFKNQPFFFLLQGYHIGLNLSVKEN